MPDRDRIICMTRLSILEKEYGKQIMEAGSSFCYDWVVSRMLRAALRITCIFIFALGVWAFCRVGFILSILDGPGLKDLLICVLAAYGALLVLVMFFTALAAAGSWRRAQQALLERDRLLEILDTMNGGD